MYKQVLVAVDLSEAATQVIERGVDVASRHGAKLDIVHVLDWPLTGFDPLAGFTGINDESLIKEMRESLINVLAPYGIDEAHLHTLVGQPSSMVANLAGKLNADLLIVGSHGRRGLRALLGSTANAILPLVECDSLLVRIKTATK